MRICSVAPVMKQIPIVAKATGISRGCSRLITVAISSEDQGRGGQAEGPVDELEGTDEDRDRGEQAGDRL